MSRLNHDQEKLFRVAALCQNAIQTQRERERREGYGVDDYTEGRIVGAANLARAILRTLSGNHTDASWNGTGPSRTAG